MSFCSNLLVFFLFLLINQIRVKLKAEDASNFTYLITGGYRPTKQALAKHLVSIRTTFYREYFGDNHICGGAILSQRIILTAAHCFSRLIRARVVAKTPNRLQETMNTQEVGIKWVLVHPDYDAVRKQHDIAILHLDEDIVEDGVLAQRIGLAMGPPVPGTACTVLGWGRMFYNGPVAAEIMYVDMEIYDKGICKKQFKFMHDGLTCAGNPIDEEVDTCAGDSGGPLICDGAVVGIVSFGYGCGSGYPGFYTDVWQHRQWIEENNGCSISFQFLMLFLTIFVSFFLIN